jgi:hypothetical protein
MHPERESCETGQSLKTTVTLITMELTEIQF